MARPTVIVALPQPERSVAADGLRQAGVEALEVGNPATLAEALGARQTIDLAILDADDNLDLALELYDLLRQSGRSIPTLLVASPATLDQLAGRTGGENDEYISRPFTTEALRWRVEAICIRARTLDDGSGSAIQSSGSEAHDWSRRASIVSVFNPKGGVGKTTIAVNLASALVVRHDQRVLLVDADTVTGHVTISLGLEQVRTLLESWGDTADGGPAESLAEIAAEHPSGLRVIPLTSSPLETDTLDTSRLAAALEAARSGFDYLVVDLHPSYSSINQAIFEVSDRILVPVTPDLPAIRAAVQLRQVAIQLGFADRLAMVVNRANSGVSVADMERTVGLPALAEVRSGGLLFVRAANEGRTVIEMFPKERITTDFERLAERVRGIVDREPEPEPERRSSVFGLFRTKEPARV